LAIWGVFDGFRVFYRKYWPFRRVFEFFIENIGRSGGSLSFLSKILAVPAGF
jgi:hypothetical protein